MATPEEAIALALSLLRAGHLDAASSLLAQILDDTPNHPDALHYSGLLKARQGDAEGAVGLVRRAVEGDPANLPAWNNLGNLFMRLDRLDEAAEAYRTCLALQPDHPQALSNLGLLMRVSGDIEGAEALYRRALQARPDFPEALNNLGAIGLAYGDLPAAELLLARAVELEPRFPGARLNLGKALAGQGRLAEAATHYWEAIALGSREGVAHKLLIYALVETGRRDEALETARRWHRDAPDDAVARHHLAALSGEDVPARATDAYVEATFDAFAETFDAALDKLDYRAPQLVAGAVAALHPTPEARLLTLDAGCGTGLCAPLLRPYAARLDGMDLSAGMLAHAARRGLYDRLDKAEIEAGMAARPRAYDLIACADTLCYFGDLSGVLAAAVGALRPGGALVFTVEALDGDTGAFRLHPGHGRYAHAPAYVAASAAAAGLEVAGMSREILRREGAQAVQGLVVACRKPETT
ncbi:tetratricopeptide repeat protein [Aquabacter sp. L1I39]|uniref:tetratricopeptide repeat protein n=1 Tax=Aquabacter sp. L1I39 TaxID=2820278 RepID=UPI001ADC98DD|nr:tetratricopeptide repeat protein [Aquabacter sp. L1I39]QTL04422.1 tetratricopeptide repeat protein [Aquabacter sp. L1I39]